MPDPSRLSVSRGQLGPKCDKCDCPLLFSESMTLDSLYVCIDCYTSETGVEAVTEPKSVSGLVMD